MFEVQRYLSHDSIPWQGAMGPFGRQQDAEVWAAKLSVSVGRTYRVVGCSSGRVVAVWGSSGRRLTFPIAVAIAAVGACKIGHDIGLEDGKKLGLEEARGEFW